MVTAEKMQIRLTDIDDQVAIELPARETLALVNVIVTNLLNNLTVSIPVQNNKVAVQVCAAVQLINSIIAPSNLTCSVGQ